MSSPIKPTQRRHSAILSWAMNGLFIFPFVFASNKICIASDAPESGTKSATLPTAVDPSDELAKIEADMRSENFERRHQAMLRLWADRDTYHSWVETAAQDADPEVSRRAGWVLDRWRRGLLPDTPRDIAERLEGSSGPDTIENLLNAGLFSGAIIAIDEAIGGAASPAVIDRAKSAIRRRFPFFVRQASEQQQLPQLVAVLDRLADDAPTALAFQQLRKLTTGEDSDELPSASVRWTQSQRSRIDVILHAANGRLSKATELAEQFNAPELLRVCRMLSSDWQTLAREQSAAALAQQPDSLEWYRHWMCALVASSRCDEAAIRQQAVEKLSQSRGNEKDIDDDDPINRVRWQMLAMHGELDAAVAILKQLDPLDAAEILAEAMRFPEAFETLKFDWKELDSQISELVHDAVKSERNSSDEGTDRGSAPLARLLATMRLLTATGREALALESLQQLVNDPSLAKQEGGTATRLEIIKAVSRINRDEWISKLVIGPKETSLPGLMQQYVAIAFNAELETVGAMIEAFTRLRPNITFADRVRDTISFLGGSLPDWFEPEKDFQSLYFVLSDTKRVVRDRGNGMMLANAPRLSIDIARLFELHGQPALAKKTLATLAADGEMDATFKLAEAELNEGSVQVARQLFETVWKTTESTGKFISRLNQADSDALIAMKAIQCESTAAMRLGDNEGAAELQQLIKLMTCTPSATLRNSFAEFLVEKSMNDEATAVYEPLLRLAAFGSTDDVQFYTIARNYDLAAAETDPNSAVNVLDLAFAGTIETTVFHPATYVSFPSYVHQRKIHNAIKSHDEVEISKQLEKLFRLDPIDINFGEKELKLMREAGMNELGTATLERIYQAGNQHLENFPLNVNMANNLAWILALADQRLDAALRLSSRAVFYEPDSTIYRDTLAEVLYRQGRTEEAILIEKACLLDDPAEWHVHEQIRRFYGRTERTVILGNDSKNVRP